MKKLYYFSGSWCSPTWLWNRLLWWLSFFWQ